MSPRDQLILWSCHIQWSVEDRTSLTVSDVLVNGDRLPRALTPGLPAKLKRLRSRLPTLDPSSTSRNGRHKRGGQRPRLLSNVGCPSSCSRLHLYARRDGRPIRPPSPWRFDPSVRPAHRPSHSRATCCWNGGNTSQSDKPRVPYRDTRSRWTRSRLAGAETCASTTRPIAEFLPDAEVVSERDAAMQELDSARHRRLSAEAEAAPAAQKDSPTRIGQPNSRRLESQRFRTR